MFSESSCEDPSVLVDLSKYFGVEVLVSLSLEGSFVFLLTMVIMEEAKVENSKAEKEVSRLEDPIGEAPPTADESSEC